jgi:hypothetical protein
MIKVVVPKGASLEVQLEEGVAAFHISYGKAAIKVKAAGSDSKGRKGTIFEARYGNEASDAEVQAPGGDIASAAPAPAPAPVPNSGIIRQPSASVG